MRAALTSVVNLVGPTLFAAEQIHCVLEDFVGLCADDGSVADDEGGHSGQSDLAREFQILLDAERVASFAEGIGHCGRIEADRCCDLAQDIVFSNVAALGVIGAEERAMERFEETLLARELGGFKGWSRIRYPVAAGHRQSGFGRHLAHSGTALLAYLGWKRVGTAFGRCVGREQVGAPLHHDIVFLLQSIDPDLADIAEWSDVVGEDDNRNRLTGSDFQSSFLSCG